MQTGMAVHDTDQEQGNAMNNGPQRRDSSHKEKKMGLRRKVYRSLSWHTAVQDNWGSVARWAFWG